MVYDQNAVHGLYKKLLNFYPQAFTEQLAESMAQSFNDLTPNESTVHFS